MLCLKVHRVCVVVAEQLPLKLRDYENHYVSVHNTMYFIGIGQL